ncbi:MAG: hypothetical protein AB8B85_19900, partial [Paracoccaceae bacterium]
MLNHFVENAGLFLKNGIIIFAESLTLSDSRPGQIAGIFVVITIIFGVAFYIRTRRQLNAIQLLDQKIRSFPDIPSFAKGHAELVHELNSDFRRKGSKETLWEAFDEFNETIVVDDIDGPLRLRNSVRPSSFINVEDLGFGVGIFRILPNTFVSAVLLLTFLGLVAALHQFAQSMNAGSGGMDQAMQNFMQIASAKFVMSLVGLFCSI